MASLKRLTKGTAPKNVQPSGFAVLSMQRTGIKWTPGYIRLAKTRAAQGDFSLAADLCNDLLADDDRVMSVVETRVNGVLSAPITFEEGADRGARRPVRALEAKEDWWAMFPPSELKRLCIWGVLLGYGWGQLVYRDEDGNLLERGGRLTPRLEVWNPRSFKYDYTKRTWVLCLDGKETPITPGDGEWILFAPYGQHPGPFALWYSLALIALYKAYAVVDSGRLGEVATILVASGPNKIVPKDREELSKALRTLGRDAGVVLDGGLGLNNLSREGAHQIYEYQISRADTATAIRVLGQNLTTEVKGTEYTGATAQTMVRQDLKEGDEDQLCTCLHDQAMVPWSVLNFGSPTVAPWPTWAVKPPEDKSKKADSLIKACDAIAKAAALDPLVDKRALMESYGIPLLSEAPPTGQGAALFQYHLEFGIVTVNEVRKFLGLEPIPGGDIRPVSSAQVGTPNPSATN